MPHDQRGDLLDLAMMERTIGARGSARTATTALGQKQSLEVGYFARGDFVTGTADRIKPPPCTRTTSTRTSTRSWATSACTAISIYTRRAGSAARGGVRADLFSYDVLDRCAAGTIAHPSRTQPARRPVVSESGGLRRIP